MHPLVFEAHTKEVASGVSNRGKHSFVLLNSGIAMCASLLLAMQGSQVKKSDFTHSVDW